MSEVKRHPLVRSIVGLLGLMVAVPLMAQSADLTATKSGPATAGANTDVTYDISLVNLGPDDAPETMLNDVIPAGMTFVSRSQNSGPTFTCSNPPPGSGGTVSCTLATLPAGSSATFSFVFHIPSGTPPGTTFTNIATASTPIDPNAENNSSAASTTVPAPPSGDVSVTKSGPSSALPNANVSYTISITNFGPGDAQTVSLQDTLPGTMTFVSFNQNSGPTFTCTTPPAGAGGTVICNIATLIAGAGAGFTLVGHIPSGTGTGTTFTNAANITSTNDSNAENNTAASGLTVASADVAATKSGPASAFAGTSITYTISVTNNGPDSADDVQLTDVLPSGTSFVSLTQNSGPAAGCTGGGTVSCSFGTVAPAASAQFTLVVAVASSVAPGTVIANTASVTSAADPNGTNNSSTASTTISTSADVTTTKSGPASATAGASLTYMLGLTNAGPSDASGVTLSDTLPPNTTFVSLTQTGGPTFTCTTPAAGSPGTVSCGPRALAGGASATFSLVVAVDPATANGTTISNAATASSGTTDPNPANNTANTSATVNTSADVAVAKSGPTTGLGSTNITYSVTVTNNGPSNAAIVAMPDALPANVTFVSLTQTAGPAFSCTAPAAGATGAINCSIALLLRGASASFDITVNLPPAGATVTNTATVTSGTPDPNAANNSSSVTTNVTSSSADLGITKTANPTAVLPNGTVTYTITVTNGGPTSAINVAVTDVLPTGTTFVSATPSQGSCSGTTTVTCNLGTLAVSASATIQLVIQASAPIGSRVSNTATVSSTTPDPVTTNNSATAPFFVVASIPALSPLALLVLGLMLASVAVMALRMR